LNEKLLLKSPKPFLWITVTPDGKQIIVERKQGETTDSKNKSQNQPGRPPAKPKVQIEFLDSENLSLQRVIKSEGIVNLEALSTGFADVIHGLSGKVWLVRFGPSGSQRQNITRVRSHCVPDILYSSGNMLLVGRCAMSSPDYSVSAFTVTGHFLWRQHWSEHRYTPKIQRSEDGSRVAVSSIARVIVPASATAENVESEAADDPDTGLQQHVQVLDTATGKEVLALTVTPAAIAAQNLSLSPNGRTLALIQGTHLEVHALPEMSPEDHAKFEQFLRTLPDIQRDMDVGEHQKSDGTKIAVSVFSQTLNYGGHRARLAAVHDVTRQKLSEDELRWRGRRAATLPKVLRRWVRRRARRSLRCGALPRAARARFHREPAGRALSNCTHWNRRSRQRPEYRLRGARLRDSECARRAAYRSSRSRGRCAGHGSCVP